MINARRMPSLVITGAIGEAIRQSQIGAGSPILLHHWQSGLAPLWLVLGDKGPNDSASDKIPCRFI
jgi:hypothetical protein